MSGHDPDARHSVGALRASRLIWRLCGYLASNVPLPAGYWLANLVGDAYFWLNPAHSRHAVENMGVVLAQPTTHTAVRRIARRSFQAYGMALLDFLRLPSLSRPAVERGVISYGWEHLEQALQRGQGAIIVAGHLGAWDRAVTLLARRGYRATLVVDAVGPAWLNLAVQSVRQRCGLSVVAADQPVALREIYRRLRQNEVVVIVLDRPLVSGGVPVRFFGRMTHVPRGPARLALETGAPVLFAWLVRRPDLLSFQGGIETLSTPTITGQRETDEQALTQAMMDALQRVVQTYPEQWSMFRPMWPVAEVHQRSVVGEPEPLE